MISFHAPYLYMFLLFSPSHQQRAKESTQIQKKGSRNIVSFGGTWHMWMRARLLSSRSCESVCVCARLNVSGLMVCIQKKVDFAAIYCHFWVCKNDNDWFHIILCDIFHRLPFCHCRHTKNWRNRNYEQKMTKRQQKKGQKRNNKSQARNICISVYSAQSLPSEKQVDGMDFCFSGVWWDCDGVGVGVCLFKNAYTIIRSTNWHGKIRRFIWTETQSYTHTHTQIDDDIIWNINK